MAECMTSTALPAPACRVSSRRWFVPASRLVAVAGLMAGTSNALAQSQQELAKKLANPVAALISVPFQLNWDHKIGPADNGTRYLLNVQPVVPVTLNDDWNLISRTIVPVISQRDIFPGAGSQFGLGDTVQSVFFSPKEPVDGLTWGAGPVLLLPTGTDTLLSGRKWGLGPTGVVLKQAGPWTYGALANHIWSVAGSNSRNDINATFVQPFVSYTTPDAVTYTLNTESTYDWEDRQWSVPVNALVSKVSKLGDQLVSFGGGVRYWADSPDAGAKGFGLRVVVTLLFPK
jgi:hypothetical protein